MSCLFDKMTDEIYEKRIVDKNKEKPETKEICYGLIVAKEEILVVIDNKTVERVEKNKFNIDINNPNNIISMCSFLRKNGLEKFKERFIQS